MSIRISWKGIKTIYVLTSTPEKVSNILIEEDIYIFILNNKQVILIV